MAWSEGRDAHLAIDAPRQHGQVVGVIDLLGVDPVEAYGRFRFWVRAAGRRHGVARRALALLAAWARDDLGLERLEVIAPVGNAAAQGVASAAGFRPEAVYRSYRQLGAHRTDSLVHALPMASWKVGPGWVDGLAEAEVEPIAVRPPTSELRLPDQPPRSREVACACAPTARPTWHPWSRPSTRRRCAGLAW